MKNSFFTNKTAVNFAASVVLTISATTMFPACSNDSVAGTDEQANSIADKPSSSSDGTTSTPFSSSSTEQSTPPINFGEQGDIIYVPDSTKYIYTNEETTLENLEEARILISGNDSLLPRVGSGDTMAVYRNYIHTDSIGPLYYGLNDQNNKFIYCGRSFYDYGKEYSFNEYSTMHYGNSVVKTIETTDATILESFEKECRAESGTYELKHNIDCKYQNKEYQDCEVDGATCTISNVDSVYFDPTWGKFSLMLLDMCSGPTLDSIQRRNLVEVLSGYTLKNYNYDSLDSYHSSHTLFTKNHLTYSYQLYRQSASCSDNDYDDILSYDVFIQDRVFPGYIQKHIVNGNKALLNEFKEDCEKENGTYNVDIFPSCIVPLDPIEMKDSTALYQYTDPNWEKYAQIVIDRCKE